MLHTKVLTYISYIQEFKLTLLRFYLDILHILEIKFLGVGQVLKIKFLLSVHILKVIAW